MRKYQGYSFPLKLKMLRLESGKSQEEFSAELGISRSCLANYETGKRQPDQEMIIKIANAFHVMTDYLIDRPAFHHVALNEKEINNAKRLKELIQNRGTALDLSTLAVEHKIALIEYYDYILSVQAQQKENEEDF